MKFNLYKSVALYSLLALTGCHDFEEMNTNPYAPVYDPTVIGGTAGRITPKTLRVASICGRSFS